MLPLCVFVSLAAQGFGSIRNHHYLWPQVVSHFSVPVPAKNKAIQHHYKRFHKDSVHIFAALEEAQPYLSYIAQQTNVRKLPSELALLPFIESRYLLNASSSQGAVGLWQMMPGTASAYGIKINHWFDGRLDLKNSTDGALDHLEYLYKQFNHNWLLAIAAYDAGEGRVKTAMRKNKAQGKKTDFWSLDLPKETRDYVPKLLALKQLIKEQYRSHALAQKVPFEIVEINHQHSIKSIETACHISLKAHQLNAANVFGITPPTGPHYLYVMRDDLDNFYDCLPNIDQLTVSIKRYKVLPNDTLSDIALKHHTSVRKIVNQNHLTSHVIKPGQVIYVPSPTFKEKLANPTRIGPQPIIHKIRKNDNLTSIAKKYGVKVSHICYWNQIGPNSPLQPNQAITIWPKRKHLTHTVKSGESLSVIAHRYHTSVKQIKATNHLTSDKIRPKQLLTIIQS